MFQQLAFKWLMNIHELSEPMEATETHRYSPEAGDAFKIKPPRSGGGRFTENETFPAAFDFLNFIDINYPMKVLP